MKLTGLITVLVWAARFSFAQDAQPNGPALERFAKTAKPLLQRYCFDCHGPEKQKARLRYDRFTAYRHEDQRLWVMIHEQLRSGEMPPEQSPQPTAHERQALLAWIEQEAAAARKTGGGDVRRLNRRELSAALQDLTGLKVNYADSMPGDGTTAGFDTGADGLQDAADSVTQIMKVTRAVVDSIRFLEAPASKLLEANLRDAVDPRKAFDAWKASGANANPRGSEKGKGVLIEPKWVGDRGGMNFNFPTPSDGGGVLRLKIVLSVRKPLPEIPNPNLWLEAGGKDIAYREITGTFEKPDELCFDIQIDDLPTGSKGLNVQLHNKVEVPYSIDGFENEDNTRPDDKDKPPGGTGLFRPSFDRKTLPAENHPVPYLVLQRVEADADYVAPWPPAEWKVDVGTIEDNLDSAKGLLRVWMERAFRRPVKDAEQERFIVLYTKLRGEKASFDEALRSAFQSVLLSSGFRYLASTSDPDPLIAHHAIASRLSFMLWGAPPDAELRALAAAGKLRDSAVLDAQADRLLADKRSAAFFRSFVIQWLELEQPITIAMDHIRKQDFRFGRHLKASMRDETILYIAQLFADNRPAKELIDSDWTMMNNILAIHNGYPQMEGGELRRVKLRDDDPRGGGILGHAGIQSMLCWMGENWIIYRGAWTLRHILDDALPPPPLDVPELNPSEHKGKPFREILKIHQANSNCAVCHRKMDPVGFAYQNFDISGRWRTVEYDHYVKSELDGKIAWVGKGDSRPVDAVGQLPRGEKFSNYKEFKRLVAEKYGNDLVRGLMKNLLLYATGRQPDVFDMAEIRATIQDQAPKGLPLRDILKSVLKSCWTADRHSIQPDQRNEK